MAQIVKRGNSYSIRCYCGETSDGKRIIKNMTWKPDEGMTPKQIEKELERQAVCFEEMCARGIVLDTNMTFEKYVKDVWLGRTETSIKPTTFRRYKGMLGRILPAIGHYKISKIQPVHLYALYDDLREEKCENTRCTPNEKALKLSKTETRPEIAKHIGVSMTTIDVIRAGKNVSYETALKFAEYFGTSVEKLFEREDI